MTISLKKTEVLLQPVDRLTSTPPVVIAGETAIPVVQSFCYLGSMLSSDANIDEDISLRIAKASYDRLPKIIFFSELKDGARTRGGQRKTYKDTLKANLKQYSIVPADLETLVMEKSKWRSLCKTSIQQFESDRIRALEAKREQRKTATIRSTACYPCQICGQTCASRIGLYSHSRTHQHWLRSGIRRVDGPVQQYCACVHVQFCISYYWYICSCVFSTSGTVVHLPNSLYLATDTCKKQKQWYFSYSIT